jgi:type I restriction enzyme M protein
MRVYDPCSGSGGMLIYSREYVKEHGEDVRDLALYGQENNGDTWAISKMNMILHGIINADIANEDTLVTPQHIDDGGELLRFDRVLTNPPFSQNYDRKTMEYQERFAFGFTPEAAKKADLMFAQHILAVLKADGLGAAGERGSVSWPLWCEISLAAITMHPYWTSRVRRALAASISSPNLPGCSSSSSI